MSIISKKKFNKSIRYLASSMILSNLPSLSHASPQKSPDETIAYCHDSSQKIISDMLTHIDLKEIEENKNSNENMRKISFINHISSLETSCLAKVKFSSPNEIKTIFNKDIMLAVTKTANYEVTQFNEKDFKKLLNLVTFLNIGFFLQSVNSEYIPDYHSKNEFKNIIGSLVHRFANALIGKHLNNRDEDFKNLSKQMFDLIHSAKTFEASLPLIEYVIQNSEFLNITDQSPLYEAVLSIQRALAASHDAGGIYFNKNRQIWQKNKDNIDIKSDVIVKNLIQIVNSIENIENKSTLSPELQKNYVRELGRFLRYEHHRENITSVLKNLILRTERKDINKLESPTAYWMEAVNALSQYNILTENNCKEFIDKNGENICDSKSILNKTLFQNSFKYDEGKIIFHTSLSKQEIDGLYHSIKQIESVYKNTIQKLNSRNNDPNERLQIFLYKSYDEYMKYKSYISDLSNAEDGGIYIESIGSFYTYSGDIGVTDRVRHEYVHYLNGRYLMDGIHGRTTLFDGKWNRMSWFEEGSAEFFAGATQTKGVQIRAPIVENLKNQTIRPIKEIINSTSKTIPIHEFYNQSYGIVLFLHFKNPEIFQNILKMIQENNVKGYDNIFENLSNNSQINLDYQEFIKELINGSKNYSYLNQHENHNFQYITLDTSNLSHSLESIQKILNSKLQINGFIINNCNVVASSEFENSQARFGCFGEVTLPLQSSTILKLNHSLENLKQDNNKHANTNCMFDDQSKLYCEGSLQSASFSFIPDSNQIEIRKHNSEQLKKIFRNSQEHFYFFVGDTLTTQLFENHQRTAASGYNYIKKQDPQKGVFSVNQNGEISYEDKSSTDKSNVTAVVSISDNKKTPIVDDKNDHEIHAKIFKFEELDERMFNSELFFDALGHVSNSLYRDELENKDGFTYFDNKFRRDYVNDLDFEIIEQPKFGRAVMEGRYIISYQKYDKKNEENDSFKVRVRKHNSHFKVITIQIKKYVANKIVDIELVNSTPIIPVTINLDENGIANQYVYKDIEHLLDSNSHYKYAFIEEPKCQSGLILENYGAIVYRKGNKCPTTPFKDEATILIRKVTNSENHPPVMRLQVTFE
ncbi:collagenase [Silvanigrella aquatica]|uniref:microbial collagenase n=1 Tax=Silvanigrella aquatica TaxID=1915309 RepID=A0A1L4CZQ0_9BACT|nr:collagenase [Silvanigrella aquatica]APJ03432.1 hypothetical protein AXG55_05740 [Silvanigrella aquatica]